MLLLLLVMIIALGVSSYFVYRNNYEPRETAVEDVSPLADEKLSDLVDALTYSMPHDVPYLEEILSRDKALTWADDHITSDKETERWLALRIYEQVPDRFETDLSDSRIEKLQGRLGDASSAMRLYAAHVLLTNEHYDGVANIINQLLSERPQTFMEPVITEGQYAEIILNSYFAKPEAEFADRAALQAYWQQWWADKGGSI